MSQKDEWGFPRGDADAEFGGKVSDDFGADHGMFETEAVLKGELDQGEKLLWSGRPEGRRMWFASLPVVLFGIPWTLFAVFWMAGASGAMDRMLMGEHKPEMPPGFQAGRLAFSLFGIPFVLIGLGMLGAPYWLIRRMKRTAYGITNRRVLIMCPGFFGGRSVQSVQPKDILGVTRVDYRDGTGSLLFNLLTTAAPVTDGGYRGSLATVGFHSISRAREVEALLRRELLAQQEPEREARED